MIKFNAGVMTMMRSSVTETIAPYSHTDEGRKILALAEQILVWEIMTPEPVHIKALSDFSLQGLMDLTENLAKGPVNPALTYFFDTLLGGKNERKREDMFVDAMALLTKFKEDICASSDPEEAVSLQFRYKVELLMGMAIARQGTDHPGSPSDYSLAIYNAVYYAQLLRGYRVFTGVVRKALINTPIFTADPTLKGIQTAVQIAESQYPATNAVNCAIQRLAFSLKSVDIRSVQSVRTWLLADTFSDREPTGLWELSAYSNLGNIF